MRPQRTGDGERILAVFIDFENLALGFSNRRDRFQIHKVLERLVEKGKIVAKKAYADWSRFGNYAALLHESAIELIEIPKRSMTGKNSADIRLVVDAIDLAYSKDHIDTFVVVSGDSDFSPLVSKLKELGKHVIGLGLQDATSNLLRDNCDEFIYYEDLDRPPILQLNDSLAVPEAKRKLFELVLDSLLALDRENKAIIFSSMVKDTMKRKKPSFNESYYGYRTFSELLEDATRHGVLEIEKHPTSGTYVVTRFGSQRRSTPVLGITQSAPALAPATPKALPVAAVGAGKSTDRDRPAIAPKPGPTVPAQEPRRAAGPAQPTPVRVLTIPTQTPVLQRPLEAEPIPLGRSLIDDADFDDDLDDIPSYGPQGTLKRNPAGTKSTSEPAAKPSRTTASEKPVAAKSPRKTSTPTSRAKTSKPAARASKVEKKPDEEQASTPAKAKTKPKAADEVRPIAKTEPKPESDDFGAGLNDE